MKKAKSLLDFILLIMLSLLVIGVIYWDFSDSLAISINDFLLLGLTVFAVRVNLYKSTKGQWVLLVLILLALPGIFTVNYNINGYSSHTVAHMGNLNFNPLSFLLLLLFLGINRRSISNLLYGSEEEQKIKSDKLMQFYYAKFKDLTPKEFNEALLIFDDYPEEAKSALNKLNEERIPGEFIRE